MSRARGLVPLVLTVASVAAAGAARAATPLPTADRPVVRVGEVRLVDTRPGRPERGLADDIRALLPRDRSRCRPLVATGEAAPAGAAGRGWRAAVGISVLTGRVRQEPAALHVRLAARGPTATIDATGAWGGDGTPLDGALRAVLGRLVDRLCIAHRDAVAAAQADGVRELLADRLGDRFVGLWIERDAANVVTGLAAAIVRPRARDVRAATSARGLPVRVEATRRTRAQLAAAARVFAADVGLAHADVRLDVPSGGVVARVPWAALTDARRAELAAAAAEHRLPLRIHGTGAEARVPGIPAWGTTPAWCPQVGGELVGRAGQRAEAIPGGGLLPTGAERVVVCVYTAGAPGTAAAEGNGGELVTAADLPAGELAEVLARIQTLPLRAEGRLFACTDEGGWRTGDGLILVDGQGRTYPVWIQAGSYTSSEEPACGGAVQTPEGLRVLGDDLSITQLLFTAVGRPWPAGPGRRTTAAWAAATPLSTADRPVVRVGEVQLVDTRPGRPERDVTAEVLAALRRAEGRCRPIVAGRAPRNVLAPDWRAQVPEQVVVGSVRRTGTALRIRLGVGQPALVPIVGNVDAGPGALLRPALRRAVSALVERMCIGHRDAVSAAQAGQLLTLMQTLTGPRFGGLWIERDAENVAVGIGVAIVAPTPEDVAAATTTGGLPVRVLTATRSEGELFEAARELAAALALQPQDLLIDVQRNGVIVRILWSALTPERAAEIEAAAAARALPVRVEGWGPLPPVPGEPAWTRTPASCPQTGRGFLRRTGWQTPSPPRERLLPSGAVRAVVCLYTRGAPGTPASSRNATTLVDSGAYPSTALPALLAALEALPRGVDEVAWCTADGRGDTGDGVILLDAENRTYPVWLVVRPLRDGESRNCGGGARTRGSTRLLPDASITRLLFAALARRSPV